MAYKLSIDLLSIQQHLNCLSSREFKVIAFKCGWFDSKHDAIGYLSRVLYVTKDRCYMVKRGFDSSFTRNVSGVD